MSTTYENITKISGLKIGGATKTKPDYVNKNVLKFPNVNLASYPSKMAVPKVHVVISQLAMLQTLIEASVEVHQPLGWVSSAQGNAISFNFIL